MKLPDFSFEKRLWKRGFKFVAGVDEVGRGCLAGPVMAACVVFAPGTKIPKGVVINDSKKLSPKKRLRAFFWIKRNCATWGVAKVSAKVIDKIGMAKATQAAMRRAVISAEKRVNKRIDYLLIDAFYTPYIRGLPMARKSARKNTKLNDTSARQKAITGGDEKSFSIAAASIVAKVQRDRLMISLGEKPRYKKYKWVSNKGYGTKEHREAITLYGPTGYHRKTFLKKL